MAQAARNLSSFFTVVVAAAAAAVGHCRRLTASASQPLSATSTSRRFNSSCNSARPRERDAIAFDARQRSPPGRSRLFNIAFLGRSSPVRVECRVSRQAAAAKLGPQDNAPFIRVARVAWPSAPTAVFLKPELGCLTAANAPRSLTLAYKQY